MGYDITAYGAKGDGKTLDTKAIQAAIDACHAAGGGRVVVPEGRVYRSGTLILRSNVELHLEHAAVIRASNDLNDLNGLGLMKEIPKGLAVPSFDSCEYDGNPFLYFIYAKDAENVAITGTGSIDGNEEIFHGKVTPYHIEGSFYPRCPLLCLINVEKLTIRDVTLTNSAYWTTHMVGCRDVLIDGIRILNSVIMTNCDGIDPDHCQNVRIANCYIRGADDGIVFKNTEANTQYGPCENILVTGCSIVSTSAAFKFGTETVSEFSNITVENCNIMSGTNRGISLQLRDGGNIFDVTFENININTTLTRKPYWWGDAEPIAVTAVKRHANSPVGTIRNVQFRNINCHGENGILICGDTDENGMGTGNIDGLLFDNIHVTLEKHSDEPWATYDLRPTVDGGILSEPHHGFFARHAGRITLRGCHFAADPSAEQLAGSLISCDDCDVVRE